MREIRTSGSEGGGTGYSTGPPYPYHAWAPSEPCCPAAGETPKKENARPEPGAVFLLPEKRRSYRREVAVMLPSPVLAKPVTM